MRDLDGTIAEHIPLAPLTTMRVGGPARYFVRAASRAQVIAAARWARDLDLPMLVLGRGSNLLIGDEGFPGLVLQLAIPGLRCVTAGDAVEATAGAGEPWHRLVNLAVARNWAGVECLAGIPGLVGATPVQNVGAYGQEVSGVIARVETFDRQTGELATFDNAACAFGYRDSRFKREDRDRHIILAVTFRLRPDGAPTVNYIELERELAAWQISAPSLQDVHRAVLAIRRRKSMLLAPHDPNARSVGSFFMNPLLSPEEMAALDAVIAARLPGAHIPRFARPNGFKIPAAWLIERSGFARGHAAGPVGLSSQHVQAIVNRGGATARDVLALARTIRDRVRHLFGVTLLPEPTMIGISMDA